MITNYQILFANHKYQNQLLIFFFIVLFFALMCELEALMLSRKDRQHVIVKILCVFLSF